MSVNACTPKMPENRIASITIRKSTPSRLLVHTSPSLSLSPPPSLTNPHSFHKPRHTQASFIDRTPSSLENDDSKQGGGLVTFYTISCLSTSGKRWIVERRYSDFNNLYTSCKKLGSLNNKPGRAYTFPKKVWGMFRSGANEV